MNVQIISYRKKAFWVIAALVIASIDLFYTIATEIPERFIVWYSDIERKQQYWSILVSYWW